MRKYILLLLIIPFVFACSSDDDNNGINKPDTPNYSKTDSIFNYRFGASIEDIKPDIVRSKDLAFSYDKSGDISPGTVFYFQDNKLTTVSKYYASSILVNPYQELFLNDVSKLNPPKAIEIIKPAIGDYITYLKEDSTSWTYGHLKILVRNDYFSFQEKLENLKEHYLVIEYKK